MKADELLEKGFFDVRQDSHGNLLFAGERIALFDGEALWHIKNELIASIGFSPTKSVLMRFGYACGKHMARVLKQFEWDSPDEMLKAGLQFNFFKGFARCELKEIFIDPQKKECKIKGVWRHSLEGEAHLKLSGISKDPVCWYLEGCASGFLSELCRMDIIAYEERCIAQGYETCEFIAKSRNLFDVLPREAYFLEAQPIDETLRFFQTLFSKTGGSPQIFLSQFRTIIDHIQEGVAIGDFPSSVADTRFLFVNKRFSEMLGYTPDELTHRQIMSLMWDDAEKERLLTEFSKRRKGVSSSYESTFRSKNNKKVICRVSGSPIFDTNGKIMGITAAVIDITRQKQMEEENLKNIRRLETFAQKRYAGLSPKEMRLQRLFDRSKDIFYQSTVDGNFTHINPAAEELFGWTIEEFLIKVTAPDLYFNPEDRLRFMSELDARGYVNDYETVTRTKRGEKIYVSETAYKIYNETGEHIGYEGILRNITERVHSRDAIQQIREFSENIIESIHVGVVVFNGDLRITMFNNAMERITGVSRQRAEGHFLWDIVPSLKEAKIEKLVRDAFNGRTTEFKDIMILSEAGKTEWTNHTYFPLRNMRGGIIGVVGLIDETTEKKQLVADTEAAQRNVIEALLSTLEERDPYTRGHSTRMERLSMRIAEKLNLPEHEQQILKQATLLHDIGKIGISETILNKPAKLSEKEYEVMKTHSIRSYQMLISFPHLKEVAEIIRYHHERPDGRGYLGVPGGEIPLLSRIVAVVDTFEAMTSTRPYRKALSAESAIEELRRVSGTQLDGRIVEILIQVVGENGDLN